MEQLHFKQFNKKPDWRLYKVMKHFTQVRVVQGWGQHDGAQCSTFIEHFVKVFLLFSHLHSLEPV